MRSVHDHERIPLAGRGDILAMVIRQGMTITLCGVAGGLGLSFAAVRLMSGLLFEVSQTDPITYAGSAVAFALVAAADESGGDQ